MASRQHSVKQAVGNKFLTGQVNFRIFLDFFSEENLSRPIKIPVVCTIEHLVGFRVFHQLITDQFL